jgi:predicted Fe-S protein YdhL (DUF1289 family)
MPLSPCTGTCELDALGICLGCGRSLAEIAAWPGADASLRGEIVKRALQRRAAAPGKLR